MHLFLTCVCCNTCLLYSDSNSFFLFLCLTGKKKITLSHQSNPFTSELTRCPPTPPFQSGVLTREQENELRKTFDDHDEDGSGAIDITEFERIAIDLGEPLSSEELQEIIKDLDKDGSGVVSYDEFIRWWRQT